MKNLPVVLLVLLLFVGTFALASGTRTLTDIKGPVFAVGALILAVLALLALLLRRATLRPVAPFAAMAVLYLAYASLAVLWASHPWVVKYVVADRFLSLILALSVAVLIADLRAWRLLAAAYVFLGAFAAAFSLYWHVVAPAFKVFGKITSLQLFDLVRRGLDDLRAPLGNANLLAALLLVALCFAAGFALREFRGQRRLEVFLPLAVFALLVLPVLYFCRAFSYYIALFVAAAVFLALQAKKPFSVFAVALLIACVLFPVAWKTGLVARFMETKSYLVRAELWRRALLMSAQRPVFGWGSGNYFTDNQPFAGDHMLEMVRFREGGADKYEPLYKVPAGGDAYVHNEYLQELSEGGAVGLLIYLALLSASVAAALDAKKRGFDEVPLLSAAVAAFAACLTANFFNCEIHFHDFGPHFWILAGFLVAARHTMSPLPSAPVEFHFGRVFLGCLAVIAAAYGVYTFAVQDYRSSVLFQRANGFYAGQDRPLAPRAYLSSARLTWDPMLRARALYSAGFTYHVLGDRDSAYNTFDVSGREIAAMLDTDFRLGQMLQDSSLYEKALYHYRRDKAGHPEHQGIDGRIAITEALLYLQQGRLNDGLTKGRDYFVDFPDDQVNRRVFLRSMLSPQIRYRAELDIQTHQILSADASPEDFALVGIARYLQGDPQSALPLLEKAKALGYQGRDGFYFLANSYIDLGRLDDARAVVAGGRKIHPQCRGLSYLADRLGLANSPAGPTAPPVSP